MNRLRSIAALVLFPNLLLGAEPQWAFISAQAPGATKWNVLQKTASVTISKGRLQALVYRGGNSPHMTIEGTIKDGKIKAKAVIDGTEGDELILVGAYHRTSWEDGVTETIMLWDDSYFIGLTRLLPAEQHAQ